MKERQLEYHTIQWHVIKSTHIRILNLPVLQDVTTITHIAPGLAHSSLISNKQLRDNGCNVMFTKIDCRVFHKAELVIVGKHHPDTGLWIVPTNKNHPPLSRVMPPTTCIKLPPRPN